MENLKSFFKTMGQHLLRALFWITLVIIISLILMILRYGTDLPNYKKLATYAPPVATRLYAADGSLLIEYAEERRVFIDYADMPPMLVIHYAEDKILAHPGWFSIIRAGVIIFVFGGPTRFTGVNYYSTSCEKLLSY